jgi:hypothetical protein
MLRPDPQSELQNLHPKLEQSTYVVFDDVVPCISE